MTNGLSKQAPLPPSSASPAAQTTHDAVDGVTCCIYPWHDLLDVGQPSSIIIIIPIPI